MSNKWIRNKEECLAVEGMSDLQWDILLRVATECSRLATALEEIQKEAKERWSAFVENGIDATHALDVIERLGLISEEALEDE